MRTVPVLIAFFSFLQLCAVAQSIDSLSSVLQRQLSATDRVDALNQLAFEYVQYSVDKSEALASEALELAEAGTYDKGMGDSYNVLGICASIKGETPRAVDLFFQSLRIRENLDGQKAVAKVLNNLAGAYLNTKEYDKAFEYTDKSLRMIQQSGDELVIGNGWLSKGMIWSYKGNYDSALAAYDKASDFFQHGGHFRSVVTATISKIEVYASMGDYRNALGTLQSTEASIKNPDPHTRYTIEIARGRILTHLNDKNNAILSLHKGRSIAVQAGANNLLTDIYRTMAASFEHFGMFDSAYHYQKKYMALSMDAVSIERARQTSILEQLYKNEQRDRELESSRHEIETQRSYIMVAGALLVLTLGFTTLVYYYYHQSKKNQLQLLRLNQETLEQKEELATQASQLSAINRKMDEINQDLEAEVKARTEKIIEQNKKLIDYAFFNAHHLRGPLARVLGLVHLMRMQPLSEECTDMLSKLDASASELNQVVADINKHLDDENYTQVAPARKPE